MISVALLLLWLSPGYGFNAPYIRAWMPGLTRAHTHSHTRKQCVSGMATTKRRVFFKAHSTFLQELLVRYWTRFSQSRLAVRMLTVAKAAHAIWRSCNGGNKEAASEERMNRRRVEEEKQSEAMKTLFILPAAGPLRSIYHISTS